MAISEKIELLGKGLYKDIPDVLTLKAIPTASELDYVSGDDFQATMLDIIFPKAIEEQANFRQLLEIDFQWICRCLRMLNYGPYYTTTTIYCPDCDQISHGEYQVDLQSIDVKVLPEGFVNKIVISRDEFIDFDGDIVLHLPTIQEMMNADKDTLFTDSNGDINRGLSRLCYTITSVGNKTNISPTEVKFLLQNKLSPADFFVLRSKASELTDYGLRAGGKTICPKCSSKEAAFIALVDDRFFRPTLGNLRTWKANRNAENSDKSSTSDGENRQGSENLPAVTTAKV